MSTIDTNVEFIESIYIHNGHSFHGGFGSSGVLQAVDISDPHNMVLMDASYSDLFCQMVTEMKPYIPDNWMRIAFVIDLIYIDGVVVQETPEITYALFSPVAEGNPWATDLLTEPDGGVLFADNDGELDTEVGVSGVMFVNRALSAAEVSALGVANGSPIPAPW